MAGCTGAKIAPDGYGWLAITPTFGAGPTNVTLVSSPPFSPDTIYASNGVEISRSLDGGCNWRVVFDVGTATTSASRVLSGTGQITALSTYSVERFMRLWVALGRDVRRDSC